MSDNTKPEGPYTMFKITDGVYSVEGPTMVNSWYPSPEAGQELTDALNRAWHSGRASVEGTGKRFSEEEVRAMLLEIRNDAELPSDKRWINQFAAKHGINI